MTAHKGVGLEKSQALPKPQSRAEDARSEKSRVAIKRKRGPEGGGKKRSERR